MFVEKIEQEVASFTGERTVNKRFVDKALEEGFPSRKSESFKYVNLQDIEKSQYTYSDDGYRVSIDQQNIEVLPIDEAREKYGILIANRFEKFYREQKRFFPLINYGMASKGLCIFINESIDEVVNIEEVFDLSSHMAYPQLHFFIAKGVNISLHHKIKVLGDDNFINRCVDMNIERGAQVEVYETSEIKKSNRLCFYTSASVKGEASFIHKSGTLGCKLFHSEIVAFLHEKHASASLEGFWNGDGDSEISHRVHCSHLAEHTYSRQHYQGVVDGKARAVFEGQIYIDSIAQKTDSYQLSKHLLLGEDSRGFSKPNLEVFADDVKASHGATVSRLHDDELFYLMTRGVTKDDAILLLKESFLSFFVHQLDDPCVRKSFMGSIK